MKFAQNMENSEYIMINKWLYEMSSLSSEAAFKSLFLHYYNRILRYVSIYIHSIEDAEEIVSDTFMVIWDKRATLPDMPAFQASLYTIARNKAISCYRQSNKNTDQLDDIKINLFENCDYSPDAQLISKETVVRINAAIESLPNRTKEVFKLVREDGLKYKEVAQILNISEKTVEAHITLAVKKLKENILFDTDIL